MIKFLKSLKFFPDKKYDYSPSKCHPTISRQAFVDYLLGHNEYKLAASQLVKYYCICAPLSDGIDRLGKAISSIRPQIYDTINKEFLPKHPANQLLLNPNLNNNCIEFMEQYSSFFNLVGDSYLIMNSIGKDNIPRQLFVIPPQNVTINTGTDGSIDMYNVQIGSRFYTYKPQIDIDRGKRFFSKINNADSELFHTRNFNPTSSGFNVKGKSKLNPIYYEIEQYIASSVHNLSVLKRGHTGGGILTSDSDLSDDDFNRLKAQFDEYYAGDSNAGRPLLLMNGLTFQSNAQSNKDMDFLELRKNVTVMIYRKLSIPIPSISEDTMTLANVEASKTLLYDEGVIPIINRLYADMTTFIMPRYPDSENLIIWYNPADIPALESRKVDNLIKINSMGVILPNETRAQLGFTPLEGGYDLYQPASMVPYARDVEAVNDDNSNNSSNNTSENDDEK